MGFEKIKIPEDNSVADAMKSFRGAAGDQTTESWLVLGYQQGSKNAICVLGQGEGSVQEARAMFPEKDAAYALFRKAHKVEMARTVKFAALFWMPERASPMRKALLSTHKGQMEDLLKPYHVNVICDCQKELDEAEADIMDKIGFSSGTKSQVTNKKAWSAIGGNIAAGATNEMTGTVGAGERANSSTGYQGGVKHDLVHKSTLQSRGLKLDDEEAIKAALKAVRNDSDETDWCLVHYANDSTLSLVGQGTGGPDELAANLTDEEAFYGLFRVTEQVDKSVTIKFGFVSLMTQKLSPVKRAKMSTHGGFVKELFEPYHSDFYIDSPEEMSLSIAMDKIGIYSGQKSQVTDKSESKMGRMMKSSKGGVQNIQAIEVKECLLSDNEVAVKDAVLAVRNDANEVDFVTGVVEVRKSDTYLNLNQTGTGGRAAALATFDDSKVNVAFFRTLDERDNVRFIFVKFQPSSLAPTNKAKISTQAQNIFKFFDPYHAEFFTEDLEDVTDEAVARKLSTQH